jgi:hypothetical protein
MKHTVTALIAPPRCLQGITLTAALSLVLVCAIPAMAAPITYNYTGQYFNSFSNGSIFSPSEFVTASVTLAAPLDEPNQEYSLVDGGIVQTNPNDCEDLCGDVLAWSIGDATDTLSSANGNFLYTLFFETDAEGNIYNWEIDAFVSGVDVYPQLHTAGNYGPEPGGQDYDYSPVGPSVAYSEFVPGTWSEGPASASVPEPGTLTLLFAGLAAGALKRKGTKPPQR